MSKTNYYSVFLLDETYLPMLIITITAQL